MVDNELLLAISDLLGAKLKAELAPVKKDIKDLGNKVNDLNNKVTNIELTLENEIIPNIQLLAENYVPAAKRYEKTADKIESMQADIDILKKVVTEHGAKLQRIS